MLPLLKLTGNRQEWAVRDLTNAVSDELQLTDEERSQRLPSGQQTTIHNRVGWAATHLRKAGLLESTRRGYNRITERGLDVLSKPINRIDLTFLDQFPGHKEFRTTNRNDVEKAVLPSAAQERTPEETIEDAFQSIREGLASDLIERVKTCSPGFFERLVIDVLVRMGYGGTRKDAGRAVGKSGDGGIDGIINEDRLGLDVIYIQAKRWDGVVSRPEIQKFAGALQGQRARKGIFITTSSFTKEAREYAAFIDTRIVLIDGEMLGDLMITYNVGVTTHTTYEMKRIDIDYFSEE
jgi:restriction system protein